MNILKKIPAGWYPHIESRFFLEEGDEGYVKYWIMLCRPRWSEWNPVDSEWFDRVGEKIFPSIEEGILACIQEIEEKFPVPKKAKKEISYSSEDVHRVFKYLRNYFKYSNQEKWPTFSKVSKGTKLSIATLDLMVEDFPEIFMKTSYLTEKEYPLGESYIELLLEGFGDEEISG